MGAPLLISLPHGLNASGVTMWAVRLVNALAGAGRACALVVHDEPPGQRALELPIDPRVEQIDARGLPPLDACEGDLTDHLPAYRLAVGVLAARAGAPVVCMPSLLGDSYGVLAELSREMPGMLRVVAVHHSDIAYNDLVCTHYADVVSAFVGVSERITGRLRRALPERAADVHEVPYGVEAPAEPAPREPLAGRPLRLLYTGRMDHEQKRITALAAMSDALRRRGVEHELALIGDGPAAAEVDALAASRPRLRRFPAAGPTEIRCALAGADLFVLSSRYEGLSVSLLEALAHGAVPVLTPSASGTGQLIVDGKTGFLAGATPESDPESAGEALAGAVERAGASGDAVLERMRCHGRELVRDRFSIERCAARYAELIDRAAAAPARVWPTDRPAAFTGGGGGGSGTVPADGAARLAALLAGLEGRRIAVYGTGRHTIELRAVLDAAPAQIVAFVDDDAARHGGTLWGTPIVAPEQLEATGATDVVLSSWLHQDAMWSRRHGFERRGLRMHPIYPPQELLSTR